MTRQEIVTALKEYFKIQELVCKHTYDKFGELSWQFLDTEILHTLLVLRRDIFKEEMFINNYHYWKSVPQHGELYTQRGYRCNICELCKSKTLKNEIYLTAHANGAGLDSTAKTLTADRMRQLIKDNKNLLPYPIRIEKEVNWLHFDKYCPNGVTEKVTEFAG